MTSQTVLRPQWPHFLCWSPIDGSLQTNFFKIPQNISKILTNSPKIPINHQKSISLKSAASLLDPNQGGPTKAKKVTYSSSLAPQACNAELVLSMLQMDFDPYLVPFTRSGSGSFQNRFGYGLKFGSRSKKILPKRIWKFGIYIIFLDQI